MALNMDLEEEYKKKLKTFEKRFPRKTRTGLAIARVVASQRFPVAPQNLPNLQHSSCSFNKDFLLMNKE